MLGNCCLSSGNGTFILLEDVEKSDSRVRFPLEEANLERRSDTWCSVCLGDYLADDKLQQIPACGHTFHMDCIDHWLAAHNTCPLCRQSILAPTKTCTVTPDASSETTVSTSSEQDANETSHESSSECSGDPEVGQSNSEPETREETEHRSSNEEESDGHNIDQNRFSRNGSHDTMQEQCDSAWCS